MDINTALKPSDITLALKVGIEKGDNICVSGPPGCGKSSLWIQAAEACGREVIVSLPGVEDVTEPGGFPWIAADHSHAKKVLFGQAHRAVTATVPSLWLWEDFITAPNSVQNAYMQWAQAREVNGHRLPDYVSIGMCTNRRTDKAGGSGITEPMKGRFTILHMMSDLDDFCNNLFLRGKDYGLSEDAIVAGASFLRFRPDLLNQFNPTLDMSNSPTERNWVAAFKHTDTGLPVHIEHALIAGRVGEGPAAELVGYMKIFRNMPSLDDILLDPVNAIIPEEPAAKFAVAVGLASKATEANFDRIVTYALRLDAAEEGEFAVLLVRDSVRRCYRVTNTKAFIKLASTPTGKLMTGNA